MKAIDIVSVPRNSLEEWHNWLNGIEARLMVLRASKRAEVRQAPSIGHRIPVNGEVYNPITKGWPKTSHNFFKTASQEGDLPEGLRGDPRFDS